jgi:hypothetical protein
MNVTDVVEEVLQFNEARSQMCHPLPPPPKSSMKKLVVTLTAVNPCNSVYVELAVETGGGGREDKV